MPCLIPGLWGSPGERNGQSVQFSCLGSSMNRRAWQAIIHTITKELNTTKWLNNNITSYSYHFLSSLLSILHSFLPSSFSFFLVRTLMIYPVSKFQEQNTILLNAFILIYIRSPNLLILYTWNFVLLDQHLPIFPPHSSVLGNHHSPLCVWLISLNMMSSMLTYVVANGRSSFFLKVYW